jgi:hypothetical protein
LFTLALSLALAGTPGPECVGGLQIACASARGKNLAVVEPYCPQEGDLVFFWSGCWLKRVAYRLFFVGPPSHVGIVVLRPDGRLALLESNCDIFAHLWGVSLTEIHPRLSGYAGPVWVRRLRCPLTPEQSCRLTQFALAQQAKPFALTHLLLPPLALPCNGPILARLQLFPACIDRKRWFCSSLVAASAVAIGFLDPYVVRPGFTDPRDLFVDRLLDLSPHWEKPISWVDDCACPARCHSINGAVWTHFASLSCSPPTSAEQPTRR